VRGAKGRAGFSEAMEIDHLRRRIVELAREERPDIIHAHSSILCGIPAYLASRQLGLPCVYEIRSFWEDSAVSAGKDEEGSLRYSAIQQTENVAGTSGRRPHHDCAGSAMR